MHRKGTYGPLPFLLVLILLSGAGHPAASQVRTTAFDGGDMAASLAEARTFTRYPTYDQYVQILQDWATDHPDICRLDTFGTSVEGRLLLALKISDRVEEEEAEPRFLYSSTMHGDEILGYVLLLRLADTLLSGYGTDPEIDALVNDLEIWINPLANPDGSFGQGADPQSLEGAIRSNSQGFDLNRTFPDAGIGSAYSTSGLPGENVHMVAFLEKHGFNLSANLHGGEEVVNYPWDHTYDLHADDGWFRFVSREYADEARAVDPGYMPNFTDGITNGADWYVIDGGRQDFVTWFLGGREVTLELSLEKMPGAETLEEFWDINYRSLINYMAQARYGIHGIVSDLETGDPLEARIAIPGHDSGYSAVTSRPAFGDFYRYLDEGTYDLVASAPGYLSDTLWNVGVEPYETTRVNFRLTAWETGVPEETGTVRLYPNPAGDWITVEWGGAGTHPVSCQLLNLHGQVLEDIRMTGSDLRIRISTRNLMAGTYFLKIHSVEGTSIHKFLKY
ncbi:MAG: M14 family zinc carboxypeptidase [Bacteroidales bacterium]